MKKIILGSIILTSVFTLTACSSKESANNGISMDVQSQTYIMEKDKNPTSSNEGFLALQISVKNESKKSIGSVYDGDFSLYDNKGNQITSEHLYDSSGDFKTISNSSSLAPGKNLSGYVVFQVTKGEEYELRYKPDVGYSEKEVKETITKVDTSQAKDYSNDYKELAKSYINQVFLDRTSDNKQLGGNINSSKQSFEEQFNNSFTKDIHSSGATYNPSKEEINSILRAIQKTNSTKGKVEYQIAEMFPNSAIVYVKPQIVSFYTVNMNEIMQSYTSKSESTSDYTSVLNEASKYLTQQLPQKIESTKITTPRNMDSKGYKLILNKDKEGKWIVDDTEDIGNYDYQNIKLAFMGEENM